LGIGALSTTGAQADAPERTNLRTFDDVSVRSEGGRIFLSEGGLETELPLSATPQRDRLLRLLEEHGPAGVKLSRDPRLIMSSGGGSGFFWWRTKTPVTDKQAPASQDSPQITPPPSPSERGLTPPGQRPAVDKKG
jgi:hypothetical protein